MTTARGLHAQVLETLGQQIVDGLLRPGTVVRPEAVAEEYGVSRSVVREALRVLQSLGLVEPRQRVGTLVRPASSWELLAPTVIRWRGASPAYFAQQRELLELRLGVEPVAAALAATNVGTDATDGTDRTAAVLAAATDMAAACDRDDSRAYLEADVRFHRALLAASGNAVFAHFAGTVEALLRTRTSESRDTITRWTHDAAARHVAVARAVVDGDADAASSAATALLRVTRDEFIAEAPAP
ncbi:GntR family transcriptional regulator [Curtobacterium citreum]|uniref:FCD domain-containing protein n=1 Tax=Curtobacterium citreum TaxID=2036 RepID=A0ABT2HE25_9MICO|nr:FCD domain-containing protein [Curtobacterium citreum]MCS6521508.1 FCD domain-containing protein [Curtobacterium citreum]TQJ28365.1 DNA-binding FadR family transcriptional regulator [Curtobacterium citreum]GGL75681.1 GntR family transcriptional regulator [Curtobacterium citreum]